MELTFDNVYNLLESTKYTADDITKDIITKGFNNYSDIIKLLLDNFYPEYEINENIQTNKTYGIGMVLAPYPSRIFEDVTILTINNFYATTIALLNNPKVKSNDSIKDIDPFGEEKWDDKLFSQQLKWNIKEFPELYNFMIKNYKNFKERSTDKKVSTIVKIILNMTYGIAIGSKHPIRCINPELIIETLSKIFNEIETKFRNYYTYIDTDMFFFTDFEKISDNICEMLDNWGYTYEIKKVNYFLSIDKKKYLLSDIPFDAHGLFMKSLSVEKQKILREEQRIKFNEHRNRKINAFLY
jgi:hypothetical protein